MFGLYKIRQTQVYFSRNGNDRDYLEANYISPTASTVIIIEF